MNSVRKVVADSVIEKSHIQGIGLTGQMHGLVLLDQYGVVLRPSILWNDQRAGEQCDEIRLRLGKERLIQITGNDAFTGFTAPKILWVRQKEPEVWERVRHILLPEDYMRYKLTGEFATDRAGGAGTLLFDVKGQNLVTRRSQKAGNPIGISTFHFRRAPNNSFDFPRRSRRTRIGAGSTSGVVKALWDNLAKVMTTVLVSPKCSLMSNWSQ